jgi:tricorn protease
MPPARALVHLAGEEVLLFVLPDPDKEAAKDPEKDALRKPGGVLVKALGNERLLRYRDWVARQRAYVHEASEGRIGYVHIPDMGPWGYAEFHRGFLAEVDRQGLIIDVRYNAGGSVSALILEKLARRRIGYVKSRWSQQAAPYLPYSVSGPMIALTNEYTVSDGDIFSHGFKQLELGTLIGKRTEGAVVGITHHQYLVDRTRTTQPEFFLWFADVGWNVENYGVAPDIEVEIEPQDYLRGVDPQLDRAVQVGLKSLKDNPPEAPDFSAAPSKAAPRLNNIDKE